MSPPQPSRMTRKRPSSFEAAVQAEKQAASPQVPALPASGGSMGAIAPFSEISVEKAEGENSFTIAELFEKAAELNGTTVRSFAAKS